MKILDKIRRSLAIRKLKTWHGSMSAPAKKNIFKYENGVDRIYTQEFSEALEHMCVKRHYEYTSVYVDVYWYIKPSKNIHHVYTIYYRASWDEIKKTIKSVERHELPRAMYYAFHKMQKKKEQGS